MTPEIQTWKERNGLLNTEPFRRFIGVEWEMQKEINELRGALALMGTPDADAADAARYRWFAGVATSGEFDRAEKAFECFDGAESCTKKEVDTAIDAAMKGKP